MNALNEYTGVRVHYSFTIGAIFTEGNSCECRCCEFRQYLRGVFTVDGKNAAPNMPNGKKLDPKTFNVDGVADPKNPKVFHIPGDRKDTKWAAHEYTDHKTLKPDWKNGCLFGYQDKPFRNLRPGQKLVLKLEFKFVIHDTCNKFEEVASKPLKLPDITFTAPLKDPR